MSDMISRQAAIDAIHNYWKKRLDTLPTKMTECGEVDTIIQSIDKIFEHNKTLESFIKAIPSAQPEQRWIPVSERLPEDEYVLISKIPTKVAIAIRTADPRSRKIQWRDSGFGVIQDDKVLAWMPLPEPYLERRTDEDD